MQIQPTRQDPAPSRQDPAPSRQDPAPSRQDPAPSQQEQPSFQPRPAWQIWGARAALAVFLLLVVLQLLHMAGGGL